MTQAEALLEVFKNGATFELLSALLDEPLDRVEQALRLALVAQEFPLRPQVEDVDEEPPSARTTEEPATPPPAKRKARKAAGGGSSSSLAPRPAQPEIVDLSFAIYPEALQNETAGMQRRVYDALRGGPVPLEKVAAAANYPSHIALRVLGSLRDKGLAHKRDGFVGYWELTEEVRP